jgi:predicted DNA-binding transcriptional regulator AlpA
VVSNKGFVRLEGLREFTGIRPRATLYHLMDKGLLPKPCKVGRCSLWRISDLEEWADAQKPAAELAGTEV